MTNRIFLEVAWRRLSLVLIAATLGGTLALVMESHRLMTLEEWLLRVAGGATLVVMASALGWRVWRCPQCKGHLGEKLFVKQCPHCAAALRRCGRPV
jgi:rubrerythrin